MGSLVSIVIPSRNAGHTIIETITAATGQTYSDLEVIVVDDHSEDDTQSRVASLAQPQVRLLMNRSRGASAARNTGILAARGHYIQFLDADDLLSTDKIEQQVALLEQTNGTLASSVWGRFHMSVTETEFKPNPLYELTEPIEWVCCNLQRGAMMHPGAWLLRKDLLDTGGLWDESLTLNDDGEFFVRMVLASGGLCHCSAARSYYRSGESGSLSGNKSHAAFYSRFRSLHLSMQVLFATEESERTTLAIADAFQRFVFESYPYAPELSRSAEQEVARLGGSQLRPEGGPRFKFWQQLVGWRIATKLRASRAGSLR